MCPRRSAREPIRIERLLCALRHDDVVRVGDHGARQAKVPGEIASRSSL
jgi:hypothetical protein